MKHEESALQKALIQYSDLIGLRRRCIVYSVPNEGRRVAGGILKAMGLLSGVTDLVIVSRGGKSHFVEVKTKTGRLSKAQREFRDACLWIDAPHAVVRSLDEYKNALKGWGLVP
jgi:hypothetical protein